MLKPKKLLSLLATATAATALTACASAPRAPVATAVELRPTPAPVSAPAPDITAADVMPPDLVPAVDTPLVTPEGRPACGNVQTKSASSMKNC